MFGETIDCSKKKEVKKEFQIIKNDDPAKNGITIKKKKETTLINKSGKVLDLISTENTLKYYYGTSQYLLNVEIGMVALLKNLEQIF